MIGTTWWLTGFMPFNGTKTNPKKLEMSAEIFFNSKDMAVAFEKAAKKSKDRYGNKFKYVGRSYNWVIVRW